MSFMSFNALGARRLTADPIPLADRSAAGQLALVTCQPGTPPAASHQPAAGGQSVTHPAAGGWLGMST